MSTATKKTISSKDKRASRFVWTDDQFTIEAGSANKPVAKSKSQAKRLEAGSKNK